MDISPPVFGNTCCNMLEQKNTPDCPDPSCLASGGKLASNISTYLAVSSCIGCSRMQEPTCRTSLVRLLPAQRKLSDARIVPAVLWVGSMRQHGCTTSVCAMCQAGAASTATTMRNNAASRAALHSRYKPKQINLGLLPRRQAAKTSPKQVKSLQRVLPASASQGCLPKSMLHVVSTLINLTREFFVRKLGSQHNTKERRLQHC